MDEHRVRTEELPKDLARLIDHGVWHDCTDRQRAVVLAAWDHDPLMFERKLRGVLTADNPTARLVWQSNRILAGPARRTASIPRGRGPDCPECDGSGWIETDEPLTVYKCRACDGRGHGGG